MSQPMPNPLAASGSDVAAPVRGAEDQQSPKAGLGIEMRVVRRRESAAVRAHAVQSPPMHFDALDRSRQ